MTHELQVAEAAARLQNDLDPDPLGKPRFKGNLNKWLDRHKDDVKLVLEDRGPTRLAAILRVLPSRLAKWRIGQRLQGSCADAQKARRDRASTPKPEASVEMRHEAQCNYQFEDGGYCYLYLGHEKSGIGHLGLWWVLDATARQVDCKGSARTGPPPGGETFRGTFENGTQRIP